MHCACDSKSTKTNSETYNGITKTTTVTTINGNTETTVVYTDKDGKVLDAEEGEAAFQGEKNAIEGNVNEEVEEADEEGPYSASLTIVNESDKDISELYLALTADDSWGDSIIGDDVLASGEFITYSQGAVTYYPDTLWDMGLVASDGTEASFNEIEFGELVDPENVTITLVYEVGAFYISIS